MHESEKQGKSEEGAEEPDQDATWSRLASPRPSHHTLYLVLSLPTWMQNFQALLGSWALSGLWH